ncbi:hypothetical protein [Streptomyces sp. NPDC096068]|uniref:hypothetical protein n=1 Tax=Streptomyces sp. NPDC096068 TaxID=3155424 RepID=UPI00331911D9
MTQPTPAQARARLAAFLGYEPDEHDAPFESHLDAYRAAVLREAADEAPADTTAAIEMWARLLNSADIHVHGHGHPTWAQLSPAAQDRYRKAATWLMGRVIVPPETVRAKHYRDAADAIDAETETLKADEILERDKFRPCRDASAQLRRLADEGTNR